MSYDIDGVVVPVAALADVVRSKAATGRTKDERDLPFLRTPLEERSPGHTPSTEA